MDSFLFFSFFFFFSFSFSFLSFFSFLFSFLLSSFLFFSFLSSFFFLFLLLLLLLLSSFQRRSECLVHSPSSEYENWPFRSGSVSLLLLFLSSSFSQFFFPSLLICSYLPSFASQPSLVENKTTLTLAPLNAVWSASS